MEEVIKVLVCGGRDFEDWDLLYNTLHEYWYTDPYNLIIISGVARGADNMAVKFADMFSLECLKFPADWIKHGRRAGPIRNQQMLDEGKPDIVIAFPTPKSIGTYDLIKRAQKEFIRTIIIE